MVYLNKDEDEGQEHEVNLAPITDTPLTPPREGAEISVLLPRNDAASPDALPVRYGALNFRF
jgi:hypothetical protein